MIRNLKALGLALVAVFAMSAIVASAASAQGLQGELTSDGPVTLVGTEIGAAGENALTAFGGKVEAVGSKLTGHKYNVTPHVFIPTPVTTVTLTPDYEQSKCKHTLLGVARPCTITMNGCDYVLHIEKTTETPADTYGATIDIVCPVGQKIDLDIYPAGTLPAEHATKAQFCTVTVPAQTGLKGADVTTNTVSDDFTVQGTIVNITLTKELAGCGASETKEGKFDINMTVKGLNEVGGNTGVTITD